MIQEFTCQARRKKNDEKNTTGSKLELNELHANKMWKVID